MKTVYCIVYFGIVVVATTSTTFPAATTTTATSAPVDGGEEERRLLKKILFLAESENARTKRLESVVKSLHFKAQVEERERHELKKKLDAVIKENRAMRKELAAMEERTTVLAREGWAMLKDDVDGVERVVDRVETRVEQCCCAKTTTASPVILRTTTAAAFTQPSDSTTPGVDGNVGVAACEDDEFLPIPDVCKKYIHCTGRGEGVEQECAEGTVFSPRLRVCDHPSLVPGCYHVKH